MKRYNSVRELAEDCLGPEALAEFNRLCEQAPPNPEAPWSIPLNDGSLLQVGECFTVEDTYPFFSEGYENYNARLCWDDEAYCFWYDVYPVSERVAGRACGGNLEGIERGLIRRRPDPSDEAATES